jgi:hypothetical protein
MTIPSTSPVSTTTRTSSSVMASTTTAPACKTVPGGIPLWAQW